MSYDLVTVGRANMDLYSTDIGEPFEKVRNFQAMVGGSPTNIAIATSRLGMRSAAFTGVGYDVIGDFVIDYLAGENVVTDHVARIEGKLTSLALLGVQPPSHFPLLFYRDDPADIHLTVAQATALPLESVAALQLSGNAFSRGSCADAAWYLAKTAAGSATATYVDLDLRPSDWQDPAGYGRAMRELIPLVDAVIGTEEEYAGALLAGDRDLGRVPSSAEHGEIDRAVGELAADGGPAMIVKRGPHGASVFIAGDRQDIAGFAVDVVNTVGAGDAFAGGLIRSRSIGWEWAKAVRFANACGAIQVTRHGCSAAFPREGEVLEFIDSTGGW